MSKIKQKGENHSAYPLPNDQRGTKDLKREETSEGRGGGKGRKHRDKK